MVTVEIVVTFVPFSSCVIVDSSEIYTDSNFSGSYALVSSPLAIFSELLKAAPNPPDKPS